MCVADSEKTLLCLGMARLLVSYGTIPVLRAGLPKSQIRLQFPSPTHNQYRILQAQFLLPSVLVYLLLIF